MECLVQMIVTSPALLARMPWWMEAGTGKMRLMFLLITLLHSTEKECISHLFARSLCSSLDRTHVAGTTCGAQYGVSRNCKLCAVQVLPAAGSGPLSIVLAGINHVVSKGSAPGSRCVANLSLGAGFSATLNQAVAAAVNAGVVMVVSAGNSRQRPPLMEQAWLVRVSRVHIVLYPPV
mgnify:CR=1 FL=1